MSNLAPAPGVGCPAAGAAPPLLVEGAVEKELKPADNRIMQSCYPGLCSIPCKISLQLVLLLVCVCVINLATASH